MDKLDWSNPFNKDNLGKSLLSLAPKAGGMIGSAISGGLSSGAGNIVNGLGDVAGAIPGPWGAVAGAGLKILGGGVNALFGESVNQAELNRVKGDISSLSKSANRAATATSFDDSALSGPQAVNFNVNAYSGGAFNGSADRKNEALEKELKAAYQYAQNSATNTANNLRANQTNSLLANFAAYGGPLDYDMQKTFLDNMYMNTKNSKMTSMPNSFQTPKSSLFSFADGGGIHIKKSHEGLFTKKANAAGMGVQEFASHVLANKENYPSSTVKQANFARNFGGHRNAFGGNLLTQGADFSNGLTWIENGGTHEQNPQDGVPMGIAPDGQPNLVEEGEVVFNDYVFSNRLTVPKKLREKYKLQKGTTFADAAKKVSKESTERPNDPISKRGLEDSMDTLIASQEEVRQTKKAKEFRNAIKNMPPEQLAQLQAEQDLQQQEAMNQQPEPQLSQEEMAAQELAQQGNSVYAKGGHLKNGEDTTQWLESLTPQYQALVNMYNLQNQEQLNAMPYSYQEAAVAAAEKAKNNAGDNNTWGDLPIDDMYSNNLLNDDLYNSIKAQGLNGNTYNSITPEQWKNIYGNYMQGYNEFTKANPSIPYDIRMEAGYRKQWDPTAEGYIGAFNVPTGATGPSYEDYKDWYRENVNSNLEGIYDESTWNSHGINAPLTASYMRDRGFGDPSTMLQEVTVTAPAKARKRPIKKDPDSLPKIIQPETPKASINTMDIKTPKDKGTQSYKDLPTWFRYAPVVGSALGFASSFLPADYGNANLIANAAQTAGDYDKVAFKPIGNYLTYRPEDINYNLNQLRASEQAAARNILNTSGGNSGTAMAGILANNYNSQLAQANALHNAFLANREQEQKVEDFNRSTNITNSQGFLDAAKANQAARAQSQGQYLSAVEAAAKMRQDIDDAKNASRSANLSNLFTSLGNIGKENYAINDRDRLIREGVYGSQSERPQGWTSEEWQVYKDTLLKKAKEENSANSKSADKTTKAKGGKLNKRRKGLTY